MKNPPPQEYGSIHSQWHHRSLLTCLTLEGQEPQVGWFQPLCIQGKLSTRPHSLVPSLPILPLSRKRYKSEVKDTASDPTSDPTSALKCGYLGWKPLTFFLGLYTLLSSVSTLPPGGKLWIWPSLKSPAHLFSLILSEFSKFRFLTSAHVITNVLLSFSIFPYECILETSLRGEVMPTTKYEYPCPFFHT